MDKARIERLEKRLKPVSEPLVGAVHLVDAQTERRWLAQIMRIDFDPWRTSSRYFDNEGNEIAVPGVPGSIQL